VTPPTTQEGAGASDRRRRANLYVAGALLGAALFTAVEAGLVASGHLLEAQIADAVLALALVNVGPLREMKVTTQREAAALAAVRALALVPLMRVVGLGLPMREWSEPVAALAIALPIGLVALRLAPGRLEGGSLFSLRPLRPNLYALAAGAALGLVAYLAGAPALFPDGAAGERIALGVAVGVLAACVEELVFRGLVQRTLQRAAGRLGMLTAGTVFAATYLDAGSTALVLSFALAGVVFGHTVARTDALGGAMAGHVLLVVGAGAVWPQVLDRSTLPDPEVWIVLAVAIAGAVVVACWRPRRKRQELEDPWELVDLRGRRRRLDRHRPRAPDDA